MVGALNYLLMKDELEAAKNEKRKEERVEVRPQ
jgi:hypothetical protein